MALRTRLDDGEARALVRRVRPARSSRSSRCRRSARSTPTFALRASGRVWFLRLNEGKRDEDVAGEVALVDRLRAHGLPTPEIMRAARRARHRAGGGPAGDAVSLARRARGAAERQGAGDGDAGRHRARAAASRRLGRRPPPSCRATTIRSTRSRSGSESFADDLRVADMVPALRYELHRARRRRPAAERAHPPGSLSRQRARRRRGRARGGARLRAGHLRRSTSTTWRSRSTPGAGPARASTSRRPTRSSPPTRRCARSSRPSARARRRGAAGAARFAITRITDVFLPEGVDPDLRKRKDFREYVRRLEWWLNQSG